MKKKIIVTGGDGMVGSQVKFGIRLSKRQLNILSKASIDKALTKYKPEVVLHLGAITDMLKCEENPKEAFKINVLGTQNIAQACKQHKIKLVYMSTCAVFDGKKKTAYKESDTPRPLNIYGETKLEGEKIVQKITPDALIIRTGWLFGSTEFKNKFINSIVLRLKKNKELDVTYDRYGSPTYIPDLLGSIQSLIIKKETGIYHIVNSGIASYFEVSREAKKIGKFKTKLNKVRAQDIENLKVTRSKNEVLVSSKIKLRSWEKAIKEYIENSS